MADKITWHDVKIEKPNESKWVLVTYQEKYVSEAYYDKKRKKFFGRDDFEFQSVIAWADVPDPFVKE